MIARVSGVIDQRLEDFLGFDIGLVAERDETGESESFAPQQQAELDTEVAALRDQSDRARLRRRAGDEQLRPGVRDPHAVRPQQPRPGCPHLRHDPRLALAADVSQFAETGRDRDQHPAPGRQCVVDRGLERRLRHRKDHQLRCLRQIGQGRVHPVTGDDPASLVDEVDAAPVGALEGIQRDPVAPLGRVVRGPHHRQRTWVEQLAEPSRVLSRPHLLTKASLFPVWMS